MAIALITLRRDNNRNPIPAHKEPGRWLRGEFVAVEDGSELYKKRDDWKISSRKHYFLFVTGIAEIIDGRPWLQFYENWLMAPHEAITTGGLYYSFADKAYMLDELVTAETFTGKVERLEVLEIDAVRFVDSLPMREKLRGASRLVGRGGSARLVGYEFNDLDRTHWLRIADVQGNFRARERVNLRGKGNEARGKLRIEERAQYQAGKMRLREVAGNPEAPSELIGDRSGARSVAIDGNFTRLGRSKRLLPKSSRPSEMQEDFESKFWSETEEPIFKSLVKRHADDVPPNRDPDAMDADCLDDDMVRGAG